MSITIINILIYYVIAPALYFYFFCRILPREFKWYWCALYVSLNFGLAVGGEKLGISGFALLSLEIILLFTTGVLFLGCRPLRSMTAASVAISVFSLGSGIMESIGHLIAVNITPKTFFILEFMDVGLNAVLVLMLAFAFWFIYRNFENGLKEINYFVLLLLMAPLLFMSLAERLVSDIAYGSVYVWDSEKGLVFPTANDGELLILQTFACFCLLSVLTAHKKLTDSLRNEQTVKLLKQQAREQENYVKEAQARYEQTRSFRHDVQNHLTVLAQLIKEGDTGQANSYLSNLYEAADGLSFSCRTGNAVVDALLGSKLALAEQKGIRVEYDVLIPGASLVRDIDWCIVLSNAVDNAVNESITLPKEEREMRLFGSLKGNFYLLQLENRCRRTEEPLVEGVGLANMRAVIQKYQGTLDIERADDKFRLNALFVISQQAKTMSHQTD